MRFMMLMIPKGYEKAAPGTMPDAKAVAAMMKYNKDLQDAGVLITLDGLHPPSMGARVTFAGGKPKVTDGPFAEAKEILGGYWMIQVNSREEAIQWATRCPASDNEVIEVRQVQEMEDFPADVQEAAVGFSEMQNQSGSRGAVSDEPRRFYTNPRGEDSMFKKILIGLVVIIAALVVVIALQPSDFRVERTASMAASPAAVFAQINDFHNWQAWNPWGKIDPAMKQTFEGEPAGPGAIYTWAGNNDVGEGRMTITETKPNERVTIQLEFLKPFAGTSTADFTIKPEGDKTAVTWAMYGKNNFMAKAIHLVMNMDKMIGGQFEKGLADMKTAAEGAPKQ